MLQHWVASARLLCGADLAGVGKLALEGKLFVDAASAQTAEDDNKQSSSNAIDANNNDAAAAAAAAARD